MILNFIISKVGLLWHYFHITKAIAIKLIDNQVGIKLPRRALAIADSTLKTKIACRPINQSSVMRQKRPRWQMTGSHTRHDFSPESAENAKHIAAAQIYGSWKPHDLLLSSALWSILDAVSVCVSCVFAAQHSLPLPYCETCGPSDITAHSPSDGSPVLRLAHLSARRRPHKINT